MMLMFWSFIAAVLLAFVGYVLGAALFDSTIGAVLLAIVGFVLGGALAGSLGGRAARRKGSPTRVRH